MERNGRGSKACPCLRTCVQRSSRPEPGARSSDNEKDPARADESHEANICSHRSFILAACIYTTTRSCVWTHENLYASRPCADIQNINHTRLCADTRKTPIPGSCGLRRQPCHECACATCSECPPRRDVSASDCTPVDECSNVLGEQGGEWGIGASMRMRIDNFGCNQWERCEYFSELATSLCIRVGSYPCQ